MHVISCGSNQLKVALHQPDHLSDECLVVQAERAGESLVRKVNAQRPLLRFDVLQTRLQPFRCQLLVVGPEFPERGPPVFPRSHVKQRRVDVLSSV